MSHNKLSRRAFLKAMGITAAAAGLSMREARASGLIEPLAMPLFQSSPPIMSPFPLSQVTLQAGESARNGLEMQ